MIGIRVRRRGLNLDDRPDEPEAPSSRLSVADVVTLGNAIFGFLAVCRLTAAMIGSGGQPIARRDLAAVVVLLLCAATCDLFDGLVARRFGGSRLGAELDNLADVISFGFAPAFFIFAWAGADASSPMVLASAALVLVAVIVRLARFASVPGAEGQFTGMPCPLGAMSVLTIVLLDPPMVPGLIATAFVAYLMVSRLEYPKPHGNSAIAVLAWIGVSVACLTGWALHAPGGQWLLLFGASLVLLLAVTVPLYTVASRRRAYRYADMDIDLDLTDGF